MRKFLMALAMLTTTMYFAQAKSVFTFKSN